MAIDHIRYDILTQDALRSVVQRVLADVAKEGLPGEHHFYISFDTRAEGVRVSPRLLAQYPEDITIVLQHQFWDLAVTEAGFEVGLSFGGIPERLVVPFAAVKGFFDPSVQFGLQFEEIAESTEENREDAGKARSPAALATEPKGVQNETAPAALAVPAPANPEPGDQAPKPAGSAEVVRLDRFRKK